MNINLNTSHVKVNHKINAYEEKILENLNTSHVKVNPGLTSLNEMM